MTAGMWMPELARAGSKTTSARPRPIPGNPALGGLHVNLPGVNNEPSTIFDFNGHVGIGEIRGTGMATFADGSQQRLFFDVDNRFMKGEFVGLDGACITARSGSPDSISSTRIRRIRRQPR